jgi:hypothetical protein
MSDNEEARKNMVNDLLDMYSPEDLHPDLAVHLFKHSLGRILQHPLIYSVPYNEAFNKMLNKRYEYVTRDLAKAIEAKDWGKVVFLHERPWRTQTLYQYRNEIIQDIAEYWSLLSSVWIDTENVWQNHHIWDVLWKMPEPHHVMDEDEHAALSVFLLYLFENHAALF